MKELINTIQNINKVMHDFGFNEKLVVTNDYIDVTEKDVIIRMPYTLIIKIPKEMFEGEANLKDAISQAISQAISLPVSQGK